MLSKSCVSKADSWLARTFIRHGHCHYLLQGILTSRQWKKKLPPLRIKREVFIAWQEHQQILRNPSDYSCKHRNKRRDVLHSESSGKDLGMDSMLFFHIKNWSDWSQSQQSYINLIKKGINEGPPLFKDQLCLNFRVVSNEGFAIGTLCSMLVSDSVGVVLCAGPFWGHYSHHRSALDLERTTTLFTFRTICSKLYWI